MLNQWRWIVTDIAVLASICWIPLVTSAAEIAPSQHSVGPKSTAVVRATSDYWDYPGRHGVPQRSNRAKEMLEEDLTQRAYQRAMRDLDEVVLEEELWVGEFRDGVEQNGGATGGSDDPRWIEEIPY